jgi:zinc transport system ATP-binding protein
MEPNREPMPEKTVISINNVSFAYTGGVPILEKVNLTILARDSVCIVGPNGGGKTTLLKLILGLLKPTEGRIRVFDKKPEEARLQIGYVPQYAHYDPQFPVTVLEVVLMGRLGSRFGGPYSREDKKAAEEALRLMSLLELRERLFAEISGGQRQRVLIARALACEAELLLLDEPTSNIDALVETNLFEILQDLNKRMAILMVTHDIGFISKFFRNVACINRRVVIHPTSNLTGEMIQDIYGDGVCMIRHDHNHTGQGFGND